MVSRGDGRLPVTHAAGGDDVTAVFDTPVDLLPADDPLRVPLSDIRIRGAAVVAHAALVRAVDDGYVSLSDLAVYVTAALDDAGKLA